MMNRRTVARSLTIDVLETVALVAASAYLLLILRFSLPGGAGDFRVFYESARAWIEGGDPYQAFGTVGIVANLNPPAFVAALAPLAQTSLQNATAVWYALNALALAASLLIIRDELALRLTKRLVLLGVAFAGTQAQLLLGQFAWVLMLPATLSWRAWRNGRHVSAGAWLGLLVAFKPLFLPLLGIALLRGRWRLLGSSVAAVTSIAIVGGLVGGWAAYGSWFRAGLTVEPFELYYNASLLGVIRRLGLPGASWALWAALSLAAVLLALWRLSIAAPRDCDRDLAVAHLTALLISPLGWVYYVPVAIGPLAGTLRRVRWARWQVLGSACLYVPIALAWVPNSEQVLHTASNAMIGSLYAVGLVTLWAVVLNSPEER